MLQHEDRVSDLMSVQGGLNEDQSTAGGHQSDGLLGSSDHADDEQDIAMANCVTILSSHQ